jgi:hypothetical protein
MENEPASLSQPIKPFGIALLKGKTPHDLLRMANNHISKLAVEVIITKPGDPLPLPSPVESALCQHDKANDQTVTESLSFSFRIRVDGKVIPTTMVDIAALSYTCFMDVFFPCACGRAECTSTHRGTLVVTQDHLTVWKAYSLKPCRVFVFDRQQYADEIRHAFDEFMQHYLALPADEAKCAYFLPREKLEEAVNKIEDARLREIYSNAENTLDFVEGSDRPMTLRQFRREVLFPLFRDFGVCQTQRDSNREQSHVFKIERQRSLAVDMLKRLPLELPLTLAAWIRKLGGSRAFRPEEGWAFAPAIGANVFQLWLIRKAMIRDVKDPSVAQNFPDALNDTLKNGYFDCDEWVNENWETLSPRYPGLILSTFNEMEAFIVEKQGKQPTAQTTASEVSKRLSEKRAAAARKKAKVQDPGDRQKISSVFLAKCSDGMSANAAAADVAKGAGYMQEKGNLWGLSQSYHNLKADDVKRIAGAKT